MYVDEDGCLMDLSPLTSSCDVSTLLVYRGREMCTNEVNKDYIEVIDEIDTLYKVMVSKRLNLNFYQCYILPLQLIQSQFP